MNSFFKSFLLILLALPSLRAEVEVDDFFRRLDDIDRLFAHESFEEALKCGQEATFQSAKDMCTVSCEQRGIFTMCQTVCIPVHLNSEMVTVQTVRCEDGKVTLFGSDGDIRVISREDFHRYNKNPFRELVNQIPKWFDGVYRVELRNYKRVKHTLGWKTANERKVDAIQFEGTILFKSDNAQGDGSEEAIFTIITDLSVPWFARAARVRLTGEGTMWRLHEITK